MNTSKRPGGLVCLLVALPQRIAHGLVTLGSASVLGWAPVVAPQDAQSVVLALSSFLIYLD